jgi:hypothetical protein
MLIHNYNNLDQLNEHDVFQDSNIHDYLDQLYVLNDNDLMEYILIDRQIKDKLIFVFHYEMLHETR